MAPETGAGCWVLLCCRVQYVLSRDTGELTKVPDLTLGESARNRASNAFGEHEVSHQAAE